MERSGNNQIEKVLILVPVQSVVEPDFLGAYGSLVAECARREQDTKYRFSAIVIARNIIHGTRNLAAEESINNGFDWLWMIDDDELPPPDAFFKLVAHGKEVVSPLGFMRRPPCYPSVFKEVPKRGNPDVLNYRSDLGILDRKPGLHLVDAVGAFCLLIKVSVFGSILRPFFWTSDTHGEDIFFCHKVRHEGKKKIYVDTSFEIPHLSERIKVGRDVFEQMRRGKK